ncbi:unnamed protein product [Effrenium voratum]|nr:unnamed protein product [Effrenium voratum]
MRPPRERHGSMCDAWQSLLGAGPFRDAVKPSVCLSVFASRGQDLPQLAWCLDVFMVAPTTGSPPIMLPLPLSPLSARRRMAFLMAAPWSRPWLLQTGMQSFCQGH